MTFQRIQQSAFNEMERIVTSMRLFIVISKYTKTEVEECLSHLVRCEGCMSLEVHLDARGLPQWDQREFIQHRLQVHFSNIV